ncbi:MAG: NUDIX hydrolase [Magnetococcales bacterium]|nr:NUDIX hydrolase [Magnetococcales bacterium]
MDQFPAYYYKQSAVIPVRGSGAGLRVLMISSRTRKRWVVPKGIVEPDLTPAESAAKEAVEEAGIEGRVLEPPIGHFEYAKWGGTCMVEVFVMRVETVRDRWLESFRERVWLSLEEASQRVQEDGLREILGRVPEFLVGVEERA